MARAEHFSWWMTQMHRSDVAAVFELKLQLPQLRYVTSSQAAAASLAETFVGLEVVRYRRLQGPDDDGGDAQVRIPRSRLE